jgi:hypothetical protein
MAEDRGRSGSYGNVDWDTAPGVQRRGVSPAEARRFPLADLISALGDELREAQRRARDDSQEDILKLKECSIEMGLSWEKKADGSIKFWIIELGGGVTKANTQTVALTLEPLGDVVVRAFPELSQK